MIKEVGEVFEGLFEYFHARQVHDAEVIGLGPVKAAAARDQNLLLVQQVCRSASTLDSMRWQST